MMKKVHENIYDTGKAFVVRFLRRGVKVNKNFAYDPNQKATKAKESSRDIAYNAAMKYRTAEWEEITRNGKSVINTTQLTLRPLLLRYLEEETKGIRGKDITPQPKKGWKEEETRINKILRDYGTLVDTQIRKLGRDDFKQFAKQMQGTGVSNYTVNRFLSIFSNVFKFAMKQDAYSWIESNLVEGQSLEVKQNRMRVPQYSEVEKIASYAQSPALRMAIILGLETGARRGELIKAKWEDISLVDDESNHPHIIFRDLKNGEQTKIVPLTPNAIKLLKEIDQEKRDGFIFKSATDPEKTITPHSITTAFARAKKRAVKENPALADCRFHGTRGRFITETAKKTKSVLVIAALSGHKDVNVINKHYLQLSATELAAEIGLRNKEK